MENKSKFKSETFTQALKDKSSGKTLTDEQTVIVWEGLTDLAGRKWMECVYDRGFTNIGDCEREAWVEDCTLHLYNYVLPQFRTEKSKKMSHPINYFALCAGRFYIHKIDDFIKMNEISIDGMKAASESDEDFELRVNPDYYTLTETDTTDIDYITRTQKQMWKEFYAWTKTKEAKLNDRQKSFFDEINGCFKTVNENTFYCGKATWSVLAPGFNMQSTSKLRPIQNYGASTMRNVLLRWLKSKGVVKKSSNIYRRDFLNEGLLKVRREMDID